MSATTIISANEFSKTSGDIALQVYKYTDNDGNTIYASSVNNNFINVKKITITSPPSAEHAEKARLRSLRFEKVAEELGQAREKREALREEKEEKRLQRLALINQSKPTVYEHNIYVSSPYRLWRTYRHKGRRNDDKSVQRPSIGHRTSSLNLPPSSFR